MTFSVDDLIATAQTRTEKVRVCARGDLVDRHAQLVAELGAAAASDGALGSSRTADVERLHDEIEAVQAEQQASTAEFTLRAVGPLMWANLLRDHAPRPGVDAGLRFNLASFPPAAVAACVVEPPMTVEQATKLYGDGKEPGVLPPAEWDKLFGAVYLLNEAETPYPKLPAAIERLLQSVRSSTTPGNAASLAPSSSDANDDR